MHVLWPIKLNIPLKLPSIPRYFCRIKKYHYNYLQLVEFFMFDLDFKFLSSTLLWVISFNTWNTFEWNTSVQEICHSFLFLMSLMTCVPDSILLSNKCLMLYKNGPSEPWGLCNTTEHFNVLHYVLNQRLDYFSFSFVLFPVPNKTNVLPNPLSWRTLKF